MAAVPVDTAIASRFIDRLTITQEWASPDRFPGGGLPIQLQTGSGSGMFGLPVVWIIIFGGIAGLLLGVILRFVQNRSGLVQFVTPNHLGTVDKTDSPSEDAPRQIDNKEEPHGAGEGEMKPPDIKDVVEESFEEGNYEGAVQAAYVETRRYITEVTGLRADGTHWDFFKTVDERSIPSSKDVLFNLTETYERAVFGNRDVSKQDARKAIELANELVHEVHEKHAS